MEFVAFVDQMTSFKLWEKTEREIMYCFFSGPACLLLSRSVFLCKLIVKTLVAKDITHAAISCAFSAKRRLLQK